MTGFNSATATVIFAAQGAVSWPQTLVMMAGRWSAASSARVCAGDAERGDARGRVCVGALLTAVFAWRYWF